MNIGIYTNLNRDINGQVAKKLINQINNFNDISYKLAYFGENIFEGKYLANIDSLKEIVKCSDIIIAIGGDGTVLQVVQYASQKNIPVLGINAGHLGYLTHINANDELVNMVISLLYENKYTVEERSMLESNIIGTNKKHYSLNEILVMRDVNLHVAKIKIFIDNSLADEFTGDGVMVATPTGSTAYSLSCGGPVLSPSVKAFVINALCPHILHGRPIVVDENSSIRLEISLESSNVYLANDGNIIKTNFNKVALLVKKSKKALKLIKLQENNFYNTLLRKLNYA